MSGETGEKSGPVTRVFDVVDRLVGWASGIALLCVALTIFFNATGRYLTGWSFLGGEELARLLTVWITFIGAYALVRREAHVSIDLIVRVVPPWVQRLFRGIVAAVGLATMLYLGYWAYKLTAFSFGTGQMGTTLKVPRALFFLPTLVGATLMALGFAEVLYRAVTGTLRPLPALADPLPPMDPSETDR